MLHVRRHVLVAVEKVSNVELFYDLIFVYLISTVTGVLRNPETGFFTLGAYVTYAFAFLAILQIWFYTTLLVNRYSESSFSDHLCMFLNMFCLYFMAEGIGGSSGHLFRVFNFSWAAVLANLLMHWALKYYRIKELDKNDIAIIQHFMRVLAVQLACVTAACLLPVQIGQWASLAALLIGIVFWGFDRTYSLKHAKFDHLAERCCLLVIVTFGEMVVTISTYMTRFGLQRAFYPVLVFALVVGLFLMYDFQYEYLIDRDTDKRGMRFTATNSWVVFVVGNLTLALEYMPDQNVDAFSKNVFIIVCLVFYLLTSFMLSLYNKDQFRVTSRYVMGRLACCAAIVLVGIGSGFDPEITLAADALIVYIALFDEWLFYARQKKLAEE